MAPQQKSIYDLISVVEEEDGTAILEDIKPIAEIYEELRASNVTSLLSFTGGIRLSHILNKLQDALEDYEADEEEAPGALDTVLSDAERSFLYGIYLMR
jgi:hypothetical protein